MTTSRGPTPPHVPRISTRGYYDLRTGDAVGRGSSSSGGGGGAAPAYHLYPKSYFDHTLAGSGEIAIMVHGMRNDNAGAVDKIVLARDRLHELGYAHPVVGFSYDSNVVGAHLAGRARHALAVATRIAKKNGRHLGRFIEDFAESSPGTGIRLLGHSLGSQVILSAARYLARGGRNEGAVRSVHLFGASVTAGMLAPDRYGRPLQRVVDGGVVNCYAPSDEVLGWAHRQGHIDGPLGLHGIAATAGKPFGKYSQRRVRPINHRFASYARVLRSFP